MRPVWAEIDLAAIANNCRQVRSLLKPDTQIMGIVKANAYGHGAVAVANSLLGAGATQLGVATQREGLQLRQAGIVAPILVLGYTPAEDARVSIRQVLTQTIYSLEQGKALSQAALDVGMAALVHIKIDTGMGRLGFTPHEKNVQEIAQLVQLPGLQIKGIYTHLAEADSCDKESSRRQLARFHQFLQRLKQQGLEIPLRHAANSAAIIELPEAHLDLVRPGIMLYGLYPSPAMNKEKPRLYPALSLKTRVVHVKEVEPGTSISYGGTFTTQRTTQVATLPLGYADGLMRILSNQGQALIRGQRVPIIGRICMDQCMVDVTDVGPVSVGEEVTLIGRQGGQEISADELAIKAGTINYEVVCAISERVRREYLA